MSKKSSLKVEELERSRLKVLRKIAWDIDSPNLGTMYDAIGRLASLDTSRLLLPKAMDLLSSKDRNVKQAAYTVAGKNIHGDYVNEFFLELKEMNPVEREQILQGIEEMFTNTGGPISIIEQKNWIKNLETLGREHQPVVFGLMIGLGKPGKSWVRKQIRENIKNITLGAVPKISMFPSRERKQLINILCDGASKQRRDLLPYICGVVDGSTYKYLAAFMRKSEWQERVEIAGAVSSSGIRSSSGLVMELVADTNWQVKQALLENLNIKKSKISVLLIILSHLVGESHARVRAQAERTLLILGTETCMDSTLEEQQTRLEKKFRTQLLKAAQANKDVDASWLGIEREQSDPMMDILKRITTEESIENQEIDTSDDPEGVSLSDFVKDEKQKSKGEVESISEEDKSSLLSALLGAKESSIKEESTPTIENISQIELDPTIPASSRFILILQSTSEEIGKDVPLELLQAKGIAAGLTDEEFFNALSELEEQGIIYRSSKGTVSYVDIEL
ncbi:hypothetical protein EU527_18435 [Candidatus Thorarchaeota archaeon]|nr:MAG: hypothetical protein EU527_18435 [Candidatus Thorarchaeota archaeon]